MNTEKNMSMYSKDSGACARLQETRQYLRRVRDAFRRTEVLCARAEKYRRLAGQATGRTLRQKLDGDYVADLMDAHRELQKEIRRLLRSSREAEKKILRLQDGRHRAVLQLRYLCAMDWDEVADKLHYTLRWTHKLHREALEQLTELGICREDA